MVSSWFRGSGLEGTAERFQGTAWWCFLFYTGVLTLCNSATTFVTRQSFNILKSYSRDNFRGIRLNQCIPFEVKTAFFARIRKRTL
jgi:hypothetical protein